ncbi:hypothetical protein F240042I4_61900 [Eisenbergiella tayi]
MNPERCPVSRLSVSGLPLCVPALCILCPAGMWCAGTDIPDIAKSPGHPM